MPTRTAQTTWTGDFIGGTGEVKLSSSGAAEFDVSFPTRSASAANRLTSPEELIAAAHSSCLAMQLSSLIVEIGGHPQRLIVAADVTLGPDLTGYKLSGIHLTVRGAVDGLDQEAFAKVVEAAKESCPVSKALTGVEISWEASLL
ncbi:OsmC family peroxiredoxin [Rhodococcus jostii]|uniref:OsmC family peroxiredoxin n=1 Tax=Rhodococcus jostii TaxID=132919 RepID=UPI0036430143